MGFLGNLFGKKEAVHQGQPVKKDASRTQVKTVSCARCTKQLQQLDMSRGAMTFGGSLPPLYNGVICDRCGKVECSDCKGSPMDRPCSWCKGDVSPAYEHLLK